VRRAVGGMERKFLVDDNLAKLARWLRLAGYDTAFYNPVDDNELARIAKSEQRTMITRDRKLPQRCEFDEVFLITVENPFEQLAEVARHFTLDLETRTFQRCPKCNGLLSSVKKQDYADEIPPHVYQTLDEFHRCASCGQLYWPGTHYERIRMKMEWVNEACWETD